MEKSKLTKEYLTKQIGDCQQTVVRLQNEVQQNLGAIQLAQWMLDNIELPDVSASSETGSSETEKTRSE